MELKLKDLDIGCNTAVSFVGIILEVVRNLGGTEKELQKVINEYYEGKDGEGTLSHQIGQVLTGTCIVKSMGWEEIALDKELSMDIRLNAVRQIEDEDDLIEIALRNIIFPTVNQSPRMTEKRLDKPWPFPKIVKLAISQLSDKTILELINNSDKIVNINQEGLIRVAVLVCAEEDGSYLYNNAVEIVRNTSNIVVLSQLNLDKYGMFDTIYSVANKRIDELGLRKVEKHLV